MNGQGCDLAGDEFFATIVGKHYDSLFRFAMGLTRAESEARDLTQQTFYVWATKGQQLRDRSRVKAWLYTTLHRLYLETCRRQTRFPHDQLGEFHEQLLNLAPRFDDEVDASTAVAALGQIDEVYRSAVALFYLEDCSYKEIGLILEIPLGTVRSRIARGIRQLKSRLLAHGSNDYSFTTCSAALR